MVVVVVVVHWYHHHGNSRKPSAAGCAAASIGVQGSHRPHGSASDWTEYVVWVIGVIGVFYYMANPNARQNWHAVLDENDEGEELADQVDVDDNELFDVKKKEE